MATPHADEGVGILFNIDVLYTNTLEKWGNNNNKKKVNKLVLKTSCCRVRL